MATKPKLPEDVSAGQLWKAPDGQHYEVAYVQATTVALRRATAAGRVLNVKFLTHEPIARVQAEWVLVKW